MKHLLSFEVITEFLGHVPSYRGSSHAFQKKKQKKKHPVMSVCSVTKFETVDWFLRNLVWTLRHWRAFIAVQTVKITHWLAQLWRRRGIESTIRERVKIFNTKLIFSLWEYFYKL